MMLMSVLAMCGQSVKNVKISGNVVTQDGTPVEYVNVLLKSTPYKAVTDEKGHFELNAPAGKYTMLLTSLGTQDKQMKIEIQPDKENVFQNIRMRENDHCMDQVVVTGQFSPQSMRNSLYKVRSLSAEQIRQKNPTDVQSLLNTEMGIRIANDMALGESNFELMGMSGNNVKILLDGLPLLDRGSTKQSLSQIDINTIERVEIVEGPMSVVYGTDALAGVINIITKKEKVTPKEINWNVSARVQEESAGKEYDFFDKDGIHNESVHAGFSHSCGVFASAGYSRNANGGWQGDMTGREKRWHPKDQYLVDGTVGYKRDNLNIWYRLNYVDERIYGPENPNGSRPQVIKDKDFLTDRYTHQLQSNWKVAPKFDLNMAVTYQNYKRRTRTILTNTNTHENMWDPKPGSRDVTKYDNWTARATGTWRISPKISLQPGMEYQRTTGSGDRIKGEPTIDDLALFLSAEYKPWDWMSVRPGVRTFLMADYDTPFAVPSVLTKFNLNEKMDLRFSYAYGFRTPTIQELYMNMHNAMGSLDVTLLGNPDLKPEYSNNVTGSFTYRILHNRRMRLTTTLSGFYNVFNDRIVTAILDDNGASMVARYDNVEHYKTVGGSLETNYVWGGLNANLNFSLVGRYNSLEKEGEHMPQFRFSPELTTSLSYHIDRTGTDISFYYKFTGERKEYYFGEDSNNSENNEVYLRGLPHYNYADLTLSQRLTSFLSLSLGVKNLFNLTSLETISESKKGIDTPTMSYLGCGRSWFVGLNFNLNGKIAKRK